mmetsp:Transcript_44073/g.60192  ORF Transcript_44073/g.60192 Transcript_44073/m.60192 type:complete len:111 (-) Transcript_44073:2382-2714(-)
MIPGPTNISKAEECEETSTEKMLMRYTSGSQFDHGKRHELGRKTVPHLSSPLSFRSQGKYRIVDAVYGPSLDDDLPTAFTGYLLVELSRRVVPLVEGLLATGGGGTFAVL